MPDTYCGLVILPGKFLGVALQVQVSKTLIMYVSAYFLPHILLLTSISV